MFLAQDPQEKERDRINALSARAATLDVLGGATVHNNRSTERSSAHYAPEHTGDAPPFGPETGEDPSTCPLLNIQRVVQRNPDFLRNNPAVVEVLSSRFVQDRS